MHDDKIDLMELLVDFKAGIRSLPSFLFRNKLWHILFVATAIFFSYMYKRSDLPIYKSSILISSERLDFQTCANALYDLEELLVRMDYSKLEELGYSKELVPSKMSIMEGANQGGYFTIEVYSSLKDSFSIIENLLIKYLEKNEYSNFLMKRKLNALYEQKEDLIIEMLKIDSAQAKLKSTGKDSLSRDMFRIHFSAYLGREIGLSNRKFDVNKRILEYKEDGYDFKSKIVKLIVPKKKSVILYVLISGILFLMQSAALWLLKGSS